MYKNYTNATEASTKDIGKTWQPWPIGQMDSIGWVSPTALLAAGQTKAMQDEICWYDGFAVLYEGEWNEQEAAHYVVAGLSLSSRQEPPTPTHGEKR